MTIAHAAVATRTRRTARPAEAYEAVIACTGCGTLVAVFQAAHGARTDAEHEWVDAATFRCAACMGAECP